MLGRVKEAMADAAETLRRAFAGLETHPLEPEPFEFVVREEPGPAALPRNGLEATPAQPRVMPTLREGLRLKGEGPLVARVQGEAGWASWDAEATVLRMEALGESTARKMEVPSLPKRPALHRPLEKPLPPASRRWMEPPFRAGSRQETPWLEAPAVRPGLGKMLGLAVPVYPENIHRLSKGLWMRYSLNLVRSTGENVRNLEILGLFRIPKKGVSALRHDPRQGRILLRLEPSALRSDRAPFILARRKDDGALISCFVEDS